MKNCQINTRIDEKTYAVLQGLSEKLHTTKGHLIEKGIFLLKDYFDKIEKTVGHEKGADTFLTLLSKSTEQYDELYKKLAK